MSRCFVYVEGVWCGLTPCRTQMAVMKLMKSLWRKK